MAGTGAIDDYLSELHGHVARWHRRPGDVVAEAADHLNERVEALTADGDDVDSATARAIGDYGSASDVAEAHLRAAHRPAIPTSDTRAAGVAAIVGGLAWVGLVLLVAVLPDDNTLAWLVMAQVFHLAVVLSIVAMFGLWRRHGGLAPWSLLASMPALLAMPFALFVWPIPAWTVLFGLASLLFGVPVIVRRLAPLSSAIALTTGLGISALALVLAEIFVTSTGEDFAFLDSTPAVVAMAVGFVVYAAGLIGIGRWMLSETPVAVPALPAPTPAHRTAS